MSRDVVLSVVASCFNAGDNVRAASVIWEWVKEYTRAVVWPPQFATSQIKALPIL